ncbi:MAG: SpoIIE family protein phosphatase, partial [Oscillospiraceae bacterium]|nr:SpoIIE family protein phosphatase [Oscillospiraceae bacterium]
EQPAAALALLVGVLTALAAPQLENGLAPGRAAAVLAVLFLAFDRDRASALAAALCIGLAADLAAPGNTFVHTACYGFCALATSALHRGSRVRAAGVFAAAAALFCLPLDAKTGVAALYEAVAGVLLFLLLPGRALRSIHAPEPEKRIEPSEQGLRNRLKEFASALGELYESVINVRAPEAENPAIIFDRAAESVCRDCSQRAVCWEREYGRTFNALNDATAALLQNGSGRGEDFPSYFVDRCVRFPAFLAAVNAETHAFLLRRQYRARLDGAHTRSAEQYAQLSELVRQTAEAPEAAATAAARAAYRIGLSKRAREGQTTSGDTALTFETDGGELCVLLCDGMGSGEEARQESAFAARLIERLLRAGVDASTALRTLNGALGLRAELSDSFVTVDLLLLSLKNGEGSLYKYGAAPSYVKRGPRVHRVACACLPAGLAGDDAPPETTRVRLEPGSCFVMVTDGVADAADDAWLAALLAEWDGENPQMLVSSIMADSFVHKGTADDALALALFLPKDAPRGEPREV